MFTESDYRQEAQRLADEYARNFYAPTQSMGLDADFANMSLEEAAGLIRQHQAIAKQARIDAQRQAQSRHEARENLILDAVSDLEAEKSQREWAKEAAESAQRYADARNRGSQPVSSRVEDKPLVDNIKSWIERQRNRGHYGGRKAKG